MNDFLCLERITSTLVSNISESYREICGDLPVTSSRRRAPEPEEQCLHLIERTKMIQTMEKLEKQQTQCFLYYTGLNSVLSDWYKGAITAYIQPEILTNNIRSLQKNVIETENRLTQAVSNFNSKLHCITESLSPVAYGGSNCIRKESVKAIRERLHELTLVQEEIQSNFKVNSMLCDQLQNLLTNSL